MNDERPIAPLIPPDAVAPEPILPLPVPALPTIRPTTDLLIGVAAVSHSGRVRDQVLLDALGWAPGDRLSLDLLDSTIVLRRTPTGPHCVNARGQVFLPAGIRALLGIADNDRVVLIAAPTADALMVHPAGVVLALIAGCPPPLSVPM